jgi:autotransporter adhesin
VALGAGSVNTAANQVAIGGRTISGVNAGVLGTDAVNVNQLNAATAGLAADITALEAADVILANRIDDVDDKARSGTAIAIAMGGAAFLPEKKFNVSGNLGFYRGAYAGALNVNVLIGDNLAINGGLGLGFNRGGNGDLGGRVGATFGW